MVAIFLVIVLQLDSFYPRFNRCLVGLLGVYLRCLESCFSIVVVGVVVVGVVVVVVIGIIIAAVNVVIIVVIKRITLFIVIRIIVNSGTTTITKNYNVDCYYIIIIFKHFKELM